MADKNIITTTQNLPEIWGSLLHVEHYINFTKKVETAEFQVIYKRKYF